ncbi:hypothetical protein [Actinomycetospora sp. TBRC 11914]|uniref:hypothetical protein n=1 Tax=Actinomycetospora sp. TBRC 11914 TaxID=2729387 RepID=UPI00145FC904|nr:hypothetical protein [Actinomycetospora sp. TBRC 11914]NMO88540.1 hypothetical protein [Actinomycetospora sp. TBRC 11914]
MSEPVSEPAPRPAAGSPPPAERPGGLARLGADWIAVIVAGILVVLAGLGLLPTIPFLIK